MYFCEHDGLNSFAKRMWAPWWQGNIDHSLPAVTNVPGAIQLVPLGWIVDAMSNLLAVISKVLLSVPSFEMPLLVPVVL